VHRLHRARASLAERDLPVGAAATLIVQTGGQDPLLFARAQARAGTGSRSSRSATSLRPGTGLRGEEFPSEAAAGSLRAWPSARPRSPSLALNLPPVLVYGLLDWDPSIVHFHFVHNPQAIMHVNDFAIVGTPYCLTPHGGLAAQRNTGTGLGTKYAVCCSKGRI
jgi:hypothetical protein